MRPVDLLTELAVPPVSPACRRGRFPIGYQVQPRSITGPLRFHLDSGLSQAFLPWPNSSGARLLLPLAAAQGHHLGPAALLHQLPRDCEALHIVAGGQVVHHIEHQFLHDSA